MKYSVSSYPELDLEVKILVVSHVEKINPSTQPTSTFQYFGILRRPHAHSFSASIYNSRPQCPPPATAVVVVSENGILMAQMGGMSRRGGEEGGEGLLLAGMSRDRIGGEEVGGRDLAEEEEEGGGGLVN